MIKIENECVNCGFPCIYDACRFYKVIRFYCDHCKENVDELYYFCDEQLCADCVLEQLESVEIDDYES